jgi:hypothetical protein
MRIKVLEAIFLQIAHKTLILVTFRGSFQNIAPKYVFQGNFLKITPKSQEN